jgi:hypothetical protein
MTSCPVALPALVYGGVLCHISALVRCFNYNIFRSIIFILIVLIRVWTNVSYCILFRPSFSQKILFCFLGYKFELSLLTVIFLVPVFLEIWFLVSEINENFNAESLLFFTSIFLEYFSYFRRDLNKFECRDYFIFLVHFATTLCFHVRLNIWLQWKRDTCSHGGKGE